MIARLPPLLRVLQLARDLLVKADAVAKTLSARSEEFLTRDDRKTIDQRELQRRYRSVERNPQTAVIRWKADNAQQEKAERDYLVACKLVGVDQHDVGAHGEDRREREHTVAVAVAAARVSHRGPRGERHPISLEHVGVRPRRVGFLEVAQRNQIPIPVCGQPAIQQVAVPILQQVGGCGIGGTLPVDDQLRIRRPKSAAQPRQHARKGTGACQGLLGEAKASPLPWMTSPHRVLFFEATAGNGQGGASMWLDSSMDGLLRRPTIYEVSRA